MLRYYITDRRQLGGIEELIACITRNLDRVDYVQIREKDMTPRELLALVRALPSLDRVLINDRADVAIAASAAGVHLPSGSIAPRDLRKLRAMTVAVSCHTVDEIVAAEREGADFLVFGPVFPTAGKGAPLGLGPLHEAAHAVRIPVLALGGVNESNAASCVEAGAAGIAGISMFQR
jgi:thiamine-phosphate pyrophosphorylase